MFCIISKSLVVYQSIVIRNFPDFRCFSILKVNWFLLILSNWALFIMPNFIVGLLFNGKVTDWEWYES